MTKECKICGRPKVHGRRMCVRCYQRERYANPVVRERIRKYAREYARRPKAIEKRRLRETQKAYEIIRKHEEELAKDPERLTQKFLEDLVMSSDSTWEKTEV